MIFLVTDTQLYKRLCPSVRPSIGPSVRRGDRVENDENAYNLGNISGYCIIPLTLDWFTYPESHFAIRDDATFYV